MKSRAVVVIGAGEVGAPLAEVLRSAHEVALRDIEPLPLADVGVMHVCYPFDIEDFVGTTVQYAEEYGPDLIVIDSTVVPGTSRAIEERVATPVVYSPVRGKHVNMTQELRRYAKFVAATTDEGRDAARQHFEAAGMTVRTMASPEALELAKLLETSYFGVLIAWAQEMERLSDSVRADYDEVQTFMDEIDFLPRVVFQPGFIGGHCVIPNSHLLDQIGPSLFIDAMRRSNDRKADELTRRGASSQAHLSPRSLDRDA